MTLMTARQLCPIRDRRDWDRPRLTYLSPAMYRPLFSIPWIFRPR